MRYLKKYNQLIFEGNQIPDNFIRLNSIGHVLDPDSGLIYAAFKKGGYDKENGYDIDDEVIDSLSDEERQEVEKYISTGEEIFNERADKELIDTIDDILINITDMISQYRYPSYGNWVESGTFNIWYHRVYKGRENIGFNKLWPVDLRLAKKGNMMYTFKVYNIESFTHALTSRRIGSLNLLFSSDVISDEKKKEILDTIVETLVTLSLYLKSTGYEFHINGLGEHLNTLPHAKHESLPYEEAVRKTFKSNLLYKSFNSEITVTVTHK